LLVVTYLPINDYNYTLANDMSVNSHAFNL